MIKLLDNKAVRIVFCALSGIMLGAAFNFEYLWWLCFVALVPFCLVMLHGGGLRRKAGDAFIFAFCYHAPLMWWLIEMKVILEPHCGATLAVAVMVLAITLIAAIMGLIYGAGLVFFAVVRRNRWFDCLTLAVLYALAEKLVQCLGELSFPWGRIANITVYCLPFAQTASLLGGLFVTMIVVAENAFIAKGIMSLSAHKNADAVLCVCLAVIIAGSNLCAGSLLMQQPVTNERSANVLLVQGNYPSFEKKNASVDTMLDTYIRLTAENITDDTDMVVWTESSVMHYLTDADDYYYKILQKLATDYNITLVTGALTTQQNINYNSIAVFTPDGEPHGFYNKQLLVPMGEYIPLQNIFTDIMPDVTKAMGNLSHGNKTVVYNLDEGSLNGLICYESIAPWLQGSAIAQGSELTVMVTNDSWFGNTVALREHLTHAQLRAIESGRWLMRAGNCGITAIIAPNGSIEMQLPINTRTALSGTVYYQSTRTLYGYCGDIVLYAGLLPCLVLAILYPIKHKKCNTGKRKLAELPRHGK